jgi:AraC-like DNA-binding protein
MRNAQAQPMENTDPLGAIISLLRPRTVLSKIVSGAGAYSIRKPAYQHPAFCLMLQGSCFLEAEGIGSFDLREGDFILLPRMPGFTLSSDRNLNPMPRAFSFERETRHGAQSGPATMRSLGGYFRFDSANAELVVRLMPPAVHIRRDDAGAGRIHRLVELIAEETLDERPGQTIVLDRLVEVLLMEVLRFRPLSADKERHGLLAGLADASLARALRAIHEDVAKRWTVAELARVACVSRTVFADRFAEMVGMPPMQYVLEWRMAIAKDALRRDHPSLAQLAAAIGYQSASAFSTAFARQTGVSPSDFARLGV